MRSSTTPTKTARPAKTASKPPASVRAAAAPAPAVAAPAARERAGAKAAQMTVPASATVPAKPAKAKAKLVRDGFTMPQADFDLIDALKTRALKFQRPTKKSELLRAGLHVLTALDDSRLRQALDTLVPLKTGRPRKTA